MSDSRERTQGVACRVPGINLKLKYMESLGIRMNNTALLKFSDRWLRIAGKINIYLVR